jgi:NADH-quinone oxidoreductase subunit L
LWAAGAAGAVLTSLYAFRMVFLTFFGEARHEVHHRPGWAIMLPLVVLAGLSLVGGFAETPGTLGGLTFFSDFMHRALPKAHEAHGGHALEAALQSVASAGGILGLVAAYWFFLRRPGQAKSMARSSPGATLHKLWFSGWGFDWLYDLLLVRPFLWGARVLRGDFIDSIYGAVSVLAQVLHVGASMTQTGRLRWYAMGVAAGAAVLIAIVVWA